MQGLKCFVAGFGTVEFEGATSDFLKPGIDCGSLKAMIDHNLLTICDTYKTDVTGLTRITC